VVARFLTFGLLALGILQNPSTQQASAHPTQAIRLLLLTDPLSAEIAGMEVMGSGAEGSRGYVVNLQGHVGTVGKLDRMNIQVWLLRVDGTTVTQIETLPCMDCFNSVPPTDYRQFRFGPVPAMELSGVVVSENGKLYVRQIKATFAH